MTLKYNHLRPITEQSTPFLKQEQKHLQRQYEIKGETVIPETSELFVINEELKRREPTLKTYRERFTRNFGLVGRPSSINVYDNSCSGCIATGADFMLAFGPVTDVYDANNNIMQSNSTHIIDVFITKDQASHLRDQLNKMLGGKDE